METMTQLIVEQAKILLENEPWVSKKVESLNTDEEKHLFLAVASIYAMSKAMNKK